jgi:hypothetical protein
MLDWLKILLVHKGLENPHSDVMYIRMTGLVNRVTDTRRKLQVGTAKRIGKQKGRRILQKAIVNVICGCQQNKLQENFFLLLKDWRVNINAHVSGSASDEPRPNKNLTDNFNLWFWLSPE